MRAVKPKSRYFLRPVMPISEKHGFDRGTPIDRYYIDEFLEENQESISGRCLEVHDNFYTKKFGGSRVSQSDVLDIDIKNPLANIYGDLRSLTNIKDNTYDCFVLTHTLGMVDNYQSAISECYRILKPGGVLLVVVTVVGSINPQTDFWRFTPASAAYAFGKYFRPENITLKTYGNALAGQAHWIGLSKEELTKEEMELNDPRYPILLALKAVK